MSEHESYMMRCLELAQLGIGYAAPNPMVGSVIVHNGQIIGEGFHQKCGEAHAEVNAINSVQNKALLKTSTIYVNLEPCAHFGKTPPCADLIVEHGIPNVVIGCVDSFSEVSGKGIEKLKNAGCDVLVGVLEEESRHLNRRFFTYHEQQRPYIILKWAQTEDGFIDINRSADHPIGVNWISGPEAKKLVHQWRHEEQAIMVGTNTARKDNPSLTVREVDGESPLRIVIDRLQSLPSSLHMFDNSVKTVRYSAERNHNPIAGIDEVKLDFSSSILPQILADLHGRKIQSLIVEGGRQVLQSFIDAALWDEARIIVGAKTFNDGISAPSLNRKCEETMQIGVDQLNIHYRSR